MRLLLVGALSWHPERVRTLCEQGHELWGLWSRSMAWDQGPYPEIAGCVQPVALAEAASTIRDQRIDCVYSLFQSYRRGLWGPAQPGIEHDVWTLLRILLHERHRGRFDAPIVRHWGFDVHNLDPDVVRSLDGHLFCNRQKLDYWSAPRRLGGCGLEVFGDPGAHAFLDSDRPKLEFMHDRFAAPLSDGDGEVHTVCIGRPFNIDYVAAARQGIHVHVYGNSVDEVHQAIARSLSPATARRNAELLARYLHVHTSLQAGGGGWPEVRRTKADWVGEFSRYDAAWSYVGRPLPWPDLDDRAAIPNRVGTYLLAGLPVITDRRPRSYRYEEVRRLDVEIELVDGDYDDLAARLHSEVRTREKRRNARRERDGYSFDATIEPLLAALEGMRDGYFAKPHAERSRFEPSGARRLVQLHGGRPRTAGQALDIAWEQRRRIGAARRARKLRATL